MASNPSGLNKQSAVDCLILDKFKVGPDVTRIYMFNVEGGLDTLIIDELVIKHPLRLKAWLSTLPYRSDGFSARIDGIKELVVGKLKANVVMAGPLKVLTVPEPT